MKYSSINIILPVFIFVKNYFNCWYYLTLNEKRLHLKFRSLKSPSRKKKLFYIFCNLKDYILQGRTFEHNRPDWSRFEVTVSFFSPPDILRKAMIHDSCRIPFRTSIHKTSYKYFPVYFSFLFLNTFFWFCSRLAGRRYLSGTVWEI